jgi:hypothetical protein
MKSENKQEEDQVEVTLGANASKELKALINEVIEAKSGELTAQEIIDEVLERDNPSEMEKAARYDQNLVQMINRVIGSLKTKGTRAIQESGDHPEFNFMASVKTGALIVVSEDKFVKIQEANSRHLWAMNQINNEKRTAKIATIKAIGEKEAIQVEFIASVMSDGQTLGDLQDHQGNVAL